jgi:hypothetical protein
MAVAALALFVALDGPATAARLIDGSAIRRNTITSTQIRNKTLGIADFSSTTIRMLRVTPNDSVGTMQLKPGAITTDRLADGAVTTPKLADRSVQAINLADGSVGSSTLAAGAVTASRLGTGAVGSDAIADGSLKADDLGDFAGSVSASFESFQASTCQTIGPFAPTPTNTSANAMIGDDVIVVTPPVGWPDQLTVQGNPGASNQLRIIVCNPTTDPATNPIVVPAAVRPAVFHYLGIDSP